MKGLLCFIFIISTFSENLAQYIIKNNSKIAIALVSGGTFKFSERSLLNKKQYASLNGYDLIVTEKSYNELLPTIKLSRIS